MVCLDHFMFSNMVGLRKEKIGFCVYNTNANSCISVRFQLHNTVCVHLIHRVKRQSVSNAYISSPFRKSVRYLMAILTLM